jgi:diaminopimelate epimerase
MLAEELHDRPMFPFRTNVSVVDDRGNWVAHAFFYERGVGRTEASSTGSAGAYAVLRAGIRNCLRCGS